MTELNMIYCCYPDTCINYNSGLADGYVLGIITIIMLYMFIAVINTISDMYKFKDDEETCNNNNKTEEDTDNKETKKDK
jgi:hypothetical protein